MLLLFLIPKTNGVLKVISYGENYFKPHPVLETTVHAEHDAIINLPIRPRNLHPKKVDILIIRTSKTGCLGMSKPCAHCIMKMSDLAPKRGYKINKVYYTTEDGYVTCDKLDKLIEDPDMHISKYYKSRMFC